MADETPEQLEPLVARVSRAVRAALRERAVPAESERSARAAARAALAAPPAEALSPERALARVIDHTLLKPEAAAAQIRRLCAEARQYGFATVCVNPAYVGLCAEELRGAETLVCCVAGFPLGASLPEVKAYEAECAIQDGACEIDMVINIGALKSRDHALLARDVVTVVEACHRLSAGVKVIIEAALLDDAEKILACRIAQWAGADFVKTSTGFGPGGATAADVALMRRTVGPEMGVKAAGGIRTLADARAMLAAGATRLGASAGVKILEELGGSGRMVEGRG